jgi:low temperature requirement protein LtrA
VVRALPELSVPATFPVIGVLRAVERADPLIAERPKGGTPSHAHHIVERSARLVIIALGDAIVGTVPAVLLR